MKSFIEPLESRIAPATLAISPVSASPQEGDANHDIQFHVHLDRAAGDPNTDITVHYASVAGTAVDNTDFIPLSGDLTFAGSTTDQDITVTIVGNTAVQADRAFTVELSNPSGASFVADQSKATVQIIDDDTEVSLTAVSTSVTEGNVGSSNTADLTVALPNGITLTHAVIVNLVYTDGTATQLGAGKDYDAGAVTQVTIAAGSNSATVHVPIIGDTNLGGDETFTVSLGGITGAKAKSDQSSTQITIVNDDDPVATPNLSITGPSSSLAEGQAAVFTFTLDQPAESDVVVHYTTGLPGDTAVGGAANTPGADYLAKTGTVTIPSGSLSTTVSVATVQDTTAEHNDEFFSVKVDSATATNANGAIQITTNTATATIAHDAPPSIKIDNLTFAEGNTTHDVPFQVHLSSAADQDITFTYTTAPHTTDGVAATEGDDYVGTTGTVTIAAGKTDATVFVTINGDTVSEYDEKFDVVLSNPTNATLDAAHSVAVGTIQNDDTVYSIVNPADGSSSITVDEAAHTVTFKVFRNDGTLPGSVHVDTHNGVADANARGAVAGSDFTAYSTTLDFAAGETEKTVVIPITDDNVYEGTERFTVELSNPTNAVLDPAHAVGTVLITDNETAPVVTIAAAQGTEGSVLHFNVTLSGASELPVVVNYHTTNGVTGSGVFGASASDYTAAANGTLTIQPGQTTGSIDIATIGDNLVEHNEVFTVDVSLDSNTVATLGSSSSVTGTINDDDVAHVSIIDNSIAEDAAAHELVFKVRFDKPVDSTIPITFSTINGTGANAAISGQDFTGATNASIVFPADYLTAQPSGFYEAEVHVPINTDTAQEGDENFSVKLSTTEPTKVLFNRDTATGTIINDDLGVHITDVTVKEGDSGSTTAVFTVSLDRPLTAGQTVTIDYHTADGTATSVGSALGTGAKDFEATGTKTLTFDSTHSFQTVSVTIYGDKVSEGLDANHLFETFKLQLSNAKLNNTTTLTLSDTEATGTITDDDPHTSTVSVAPVTATQAEGDTTGQVAHFTVNLTTALQHDVVVKYSVTGGTASGPSVTIPAGQLSAPIDVTYDGDQTISVPDKSVQVTIDSIDPLPASEVTTVKQSTTASTAKVTLLDDDAFIKVTQVTADAPEGAAGTSHAVTYKFSITNANGEEVTLDHDVVLTYSTADGTAKAGSDYTGIASGTKATIAKGSSSVTVPVTVIGDNLAGDDETFTLTADSVTGAHLVNSANTPTSVTTKILNDDGALPKVVVQNASGDEGGNIIFTVKLVDANGKPVAADSDLVVNFHTTDGTATATTGVAQAGSDYTAIDANSDAGKLTIPAGNTTGTFAVGAFVNTVKVYSNGEIVYADASGQTTDSAGNPYTAASPNVHTIPITVGDLQSTGVDGNFNEGAESFNIVVDSAKYASSTGNVDPANITNGVGTINPNDLPTLSIDTSTLRLTEGNNGAANQFITVKLSSQAVNPVSFTVSTSGGTATADQDYTKLTDATFTIPAGASSVQVPISILGDTTVEPDETFNVTVKLAPNAPALLPQNAASLTQTATIANDETTYSIHQAGTPGSAAVMVNEGDGFATFIVTRTDTSVASTIHYSTAEGTAKSSGDNIDFRSVSGDLSFAAGQADATIKIPIVDDHRYEGAENFTVVLSNPTNGIISTQGVGTATINDNETVPVVTVTDAKEVVEGNTGVRKMTFTVNLSQPNDTQDVTVNLNTSDIIPSGSTFAATAGEDYTAITNGTVVIPKGQTSQTFTVDVLSDNRYDSGLREQVQVNLSFADPATAGATLAGGAAVLHAHGNIVDDDPIPVATVTAASATEGSNLGFNVTLDRPSDNTVSFNYYTTDGTAHSPADYAGVSKTSPQVLTFAKGETSKQIVIASNNDVDPVTHQPISLAEGDETFQLHVAKAPGTHPVKLGAKSTNLTGTILDDDHAYVTINDVVVQEGDSGTTNAVFHVTLSSLTSKDVVLKYTTADGTATAGSDYFARSGTLIIPAGSTSADIIVPVRGDLAQETYTDASNVVHGPETFQVKLTSATNAELARAVGTGTINDSEDTGATLNVGNAQVIEGNPSGAFNDPNTSTVQFTPTLTKVLDHDITFTVSTAPAQGVVGVAQAGSDYVAQTRTMTIKANHLTPTDANGNADHFTVTVNEDNVFEQTENFAVKLTNVTGVIAGDTTGIGTIYNDDVFISARTVKWTDTDGELVTLTASKGNLTHAGISWVAVPNTNDIQFSTYGGRELAQLNVSPQEFLHADISITSTPQPGFPTTLSGLTQDHLVNVGQIRSNNLTDLGSLLELQGVDLGKVTVQGDLGSIFVGDIYNDASLQLLSVKSFGVKTPGLTSIAIGNIEHLNVAGNFDGNLQVNGNKDGSINHIRIGGILDGSAVNPTDSTLAVGTITVKGAIRDAVIGGLKGGSNDGSGSITATGDFAKIVGLTVKGDIVGGSPVINPATGLPKTGQSAFGTGRIFSSSSIDTLVVNGSVIGGGGDQSGLIFASSKLGTVRIDGNLTSGLLANPTISGLKPGVAVTGANTADQFAGAGESGSIIAGSIGAAKIGGSIQGGRIVATGAISALTVDGDVKSFGSNEAYVIAGGLNTAVALPSILVKGQASDAHFLAGYFRDIQSEQQDDPASSDPKDKITVTRAFYTPANADAQMGTIEFDGAVRNIDIVAGSMPGSFSHATGSSPIGARAYGDGLFGTADDVIISDVKTGIGVIDQAGVPSKIAQIIFKGGILADSVKHGIVAQQIGTVIIDGDVQKIVGSNDPVEVQTGTNFYYSKVL